MGGPVWPAVLSVELWRSKAMHIITEDPVSFAATPLVEQAHAVHAMHAMHHAARCSIV